MCVGVEVQLRRLMSNNSIRIHLDTTLRIQVKVEACLVMLFSLPVCLFILNLHMDTIYIAKALFFHVNDCLSLCARMVMSLPG